MRPLWLSPTFLGERLGGPGLTQQEAVSFGSRLNKAAWGRPPPFFIPHEGYLSAKPKDNEQRKAEKYLKEEGREKGKR